MNPEEQKKLREKIIEGIICTDISLHFQLVEFLKTVDCLHPAEETRNKLIGTIIHMMDIGNPLLTFANYMDQASLVTQEFHDQTIMEQVNGLEVTKFFVFQNLDGFLHSQVGFMQTFVLPIFQTVS